MEVGFGEVSHVVAQLGLYQVVGNHRVEELAAELYAVGLKYLQVELDVLPRFADGFILEKGTKNRHNFGLTAGSNGYIPRLVLADGERHAHHAILEGIQPHGFGVEGKLAVASEGSYQLLQLLVRLGDVVGVGHILDGFVRLDSSGCRHGRIAKERHLRRLGCSLFGCRTGYSDGRGQLHLLDKGGKLHLGKNLRKQLAVGLLHHQLLLVEVDGHVELDGGQLLREHHLLLKVDDVLLLLPLQLVGVGQQVFHAAPLADELAGGFLAHARHAGDVVAGIAPKREDVNQLPWLGNAVLLANLLWSQNLDIVVALLGLVHADVVGNQLPVVLVGRHHVGGVAVLLSAVRNGADDVVGLVPLDL